MERLWIAGDGEKVDCEGSPGPGALLQLQPHQVIHTRRSGGGGTGAMQKESPVLPFLPTAHPSFLLPSYMQDDGFLLHPLDSLSASAVADPSDCSPELSSIRVRRLLLLLLPTFLRFLRFLRSVFAGFFSCFSRAFFDPFTPASSSASPEFSLIGRAFLSCSPPQLPVFFLFRFFLPVAGGACLHIFFLFGYMPAPAVSVVARSWAPRSIHSRKLMIGAGNLADDGLTAGAW